MTEVIAIAKNIRISPQKVRLVVSQIKKLDPQNALSILNFTPKRSAMPLKKVISSAVANAKNNFGLDENSLNFKTILVTEGPKFKRFRAVSRGRAHSIVKRTSHITVVLEGEQTKQVSKVSESEKGGSAKSTKDSGPKTKAE